MLRSVTVRIFAVLLLLIAGAEVYACDASETCVSTNTGSDGCDQPSGDNCLCCCHHVVPVSAFVLEPCDSVVQEPVPEAVARFLTVPLSIDHPPQL